jgi:hypothetical protein
MQLTLDAKRMGECLDLWRETLEARFEDEDVRGAGADRLAALNKLSGTVDGWLDLLRVAKPETDADRGALDALRTQIASFKRWAAQAQLALLIMEEMRRTAGRGSRRGDVSTR